MRLGLKLKSLFSNLSLHFVFQPDNFRKYLKTKLDHYTSKAYQTHLYQLLVITIHHLHSLLSSFDIRSFKLLIDIDQDD